MLALISLGEGDKLGDSRFSDPKGWSDLEISEVESLLRRRLPSDFRAFVKEYGGSFVGGAIDGSDDLPILCFFKAGSEREIFFEIEWNPDLIEIGALPIARCELGNRWVLNANNAVHFINYYGGTTTVRKVAASFQEFVDRIVVDSEN